MTSTNHTPRPSRWTWRTTLTHLVIFLIVNTALAFLGGSFAVSLVTGETPWDDIFRNFTYESSFRNVALYATRIWLIILVVDLIWTLVTLGRGSEAGKA